MFYLSIGAFIGAIARYVIDQKTRKKIRHFPLGTLIVNIAGSFLIGAVVGAGISEKWLLFLSVGFAGSLTTLSTFSLEIIQLFEKKAWKTAILYSSISLIGGCIAAFIGYAVLTAFVK